MPDATLSPPTNVESSAPAEAGQPTPNPASKPHPSLFRVIWRWHFYAGVIIAPIILTVAVTGGIYLFGAEIHDAWHRDLFFVAPQAERISLSEQIAKAVESVPGFKVDRIELSSDPRRSTVLALSSTEAQAARGEEEFPDSSVQVFVNPYDGSVLGTATEDKVADFFGLILEIHRELFVGTTGRILTELSTCWAAVLVFTGIYLWWPRKKAKVRGVWLPRWSAAKYTVLRDLHALTGVYLSPIMLTIAISGLFYTLVWGESFGYVSTQMMSPEPEQERPRRERGKRSKGPESPPPRVSVDEAVRIAGEKFPGLSLSLTLPTRAPRGYSGAALNDYARGTYGAMKSISFQIDRDSGEMKSIRDLADDRRYWWHCWAYPLHVGTIFGPASKVVWLMACIALAGLPVTGLWMWWQRRPTGKTGLPRKPETRVPLWLSALVVVVSILMPVVGASALLFLMLDRIVNLFQRKTPTPAAG